MEFLETSERYQAIDLVHDWTFVLDEWGRNGFLRMRSRERVLRGVLGVGTANCSSKDSRRSGMK